MALPAQGYVVGSAQLRPLAIFPQGHPKPQLGTPSVDAVDAQAHGYERSASPSKRQSWSLQHHGQPAYFYRGVRYTTLEQLQSVLKKEGVAFAQTYGGDVEGEGQGRSGRQWKLAAAGAINYLQRINSLLQDMPKFKQLVHSLFIEYAGADRRLQQHEALWLMESLGAQIGFLNPSQTFGEVSQMFFRFDFSGKGELDEPECEHLVKFMLRKARDRLSPQTAIKLCHLPKRSLDAEYSIVRQLGQGGQGAVYLVNERSADGTAARQRVVKFYSKADTNAPLDDIKEEFTMLKQLDHPMIARVLDIFEDHANVYVVSEPYFGGDMTTLLTRACEHGVTPTVDWVGRVFKQVLEGLTYLHSQMIMHCDMKEPNIMVAHDSDWNAPHVVIIDFGMAKDFGGAREGGTPGYMPPEVWEMKLWTPKGDIFSLAATFWSIFNGRRGGPFLVPDAPPYARIKLATCQQPMDCSSFPPGLRELTERMASKDFQSRPPARECLAHPFFQNLCQHRAPLDAAALDALRRAAEKRSIQNLVAMDLMSSENLGQLRHLNELFQRLDLDNDGAVQVDEARKVFAQLNIDQAQVERLISVLVGDKDSVHYSEFMAKLFLAQRGVREEQLAASFASIDTDNSGTLDLQEIEALLARPNMAEIMEGRTASDILNEIDRDGNGVIDFAEFRRAMLGESAPCSVGDPRWTEGDACRYFSRSNNMWLSCKITSVDSSTGNVAIDVKPGYWLSPQEQQSLLVRGLRLWKVGDACRYFSQTQTRFIDCRVQDVNAAGEVTIDIKPGCWLPAWAVNEPDVHPRHSINRRFTYQPEDGNQTRRMSVQAQGGMDQRLPTACSGMVESSWTLGDKGKYYSRRQAAWFDFVIIAVDSARGAVQLSAKPDYWMLPAEQREVLRRP